MDVNLRRLHRFVPEPESDDSLVDAVVKKIHGSAMPEYVRSHALVR